MATTSVRWAATEAIVDLLKAEPALAGVGVHLAYPGDLSEVPDMMFVQGISGADTVPAMAGTRTIRDDKFVVTILTKTFRMGAVGPAMVRAEELGAVLEDVIADNDTLGDLDGVVSAVASPTELIPQITPEGSFGYATHQIEVHSRLV